MLRVIVKGYSAAEAVGNCRRNAESHAQVLRQYDIGNITSAKQGWWRNDQTYALLLEDADTTEPLGAIRLQRWGNGTPLPLEAAMAGVEPRVQQWIRSHSERGVAELCGLWCSPRLKGYGMGAVLTRMGLALATQVKTRTVLGLCDTRNVAQNLRLGFELDASLASMGTFEYPRPGLRAHVLRIADARRLDAAATADRLSVNEYRSSPVGRELIEGNAGCLELTRDLRVAPLERANRVRVWADRAASVLRAPFFPLGAERA